MENARLESGNNKKKIRSEKCETEIAGKIIGQEIARLEITGKKTG